MRIVMLGLISTLAITACSGPKQKAGAEQDKAMATASGLPYNGNGPNERLGKAEDEADRAAAKARDAQVSALKEQGRNIEASADVQADKLEEQAKAIRDQAKDRSRQLDRAASVAPPAE